MVRIMSLFGFDLDWESGILEALENDQFWFSFDMEILELKSSWVSLKMELKPFWFSFDPRWTDGRAGGRPGGRVGWLKHLRKNQLWEYVSWKSLILYISLNPDFLIFFQKKMRAEISWNLVRSSRRDLSYETDSGPKSKTVETVIWDLASYFLSSYFIIPQAVYYF